MMFMGGGFIAGFFQARRNFVGPNGSPREGWAEGWAEGWIAAPRPARIAPKSTGQAQGERYGWQD